MHTLLNETQSIHHVSLYITCPSVKSHMVHKHIMKKSGDLVNYELVQYFECRLPVKAPFLLHRTPGDSKCPGKNQWLQMFKDTFIFQIKVQEICMHIRNASFYLPVNKGDHKSYYLYLCHCILKRKNLYYIFYITLYY